MNKKEVFEFLNAMYKDILIEMNVDKISEYFTQGYIQITDGVKSDINEFKSHLITLKEITKSLEVSPFYDFLYDSTEKVATLRYNVHVVKNNGYSGDVEVIALFEIADNKIVRCNELTSPIEKDSELESIGSVKYKV